MSPMRIVGLVLVVLGIVVMAWGGVFWTREHTVLDAGPVEVKTQQHEGIALPPVLGGVAVIAGILLMVLPGKRRIAS